MQGEQIVCYYPLYCTDAREQFGQEYEAPNVPLAPNVIGQNYLKTLLSLILQSHCVHNSS